MVFKSGNFPRKFVSFDVFKPSEWKLDNILPYTIKKEFARLDEYLADISIFVSRD